MNSPTYIKNVQHDVVRGGGAQPVRCLHPNLIGREEGEVARDAAGVALLGRAVADALLLGVGPSAHRSKGQEEKSLTALVKQMIGGCSPQLVLESVAGLDVRLAPPTGAPPAPQVPGVVGPAG